VFSILPPSRTRSTRGVQAERGRRRPLANPGPRNDMVVDAAGRAYDAE